jgi:multidrug transporter EmrE-like cation transporter
MTTRGLGLVVLSALLTVVSNLMLRGGVTRAGGLALSLNTLAGDLLKLAAQPLFITGLVMYGTAALVWFSVLSTENLNTSYPLLVSLTFILVTFGATMFYREPISWQKVLGIGVILTGIILIARA